MEGASSLTILSALRKRGKISDDEYYDAIRKLVLANYHFVSLNADVLMWVFRRNDYKPTPEVQRVFSTLKGPDCEENSALVVAADLTKNAWLELNFLHQKTTILELLLGALTSGRIESQVIGSYKRLLAHRFRLTLFVVKPIFEYIGIGQRQHAITGGLRLWVPGQHS